MAEQRGLRSTGGLVQHTAVESWSRVWESKPRGGGELNATAPVKLRRQLMRAALPLQKAVSRQARRQQGAWQR